MNTRLPKLLAVCLLCALASFAERPMALVIMLDGQRADSIDNLYMPRLAQLKNGQWQAGYQCAWSDCARTVPDARPSSAANHTALATGVIGAKNLVLTNNDFKKGDYAKWPTWLTRLKTAKPETRAFFIFSWKPNEDMNPVPEVEFKHGGDWDNVRELATRLASPEAPDATMIFIDQPDHGGHTSGFFPYGTMYRRCSYLSDAAIGQLLDAISGRATFAQEDWLIIVVGDHGGYTKSHGMWGGHAPTVPLVIAGKHVVNGRIPGVPSNMDTAATALEHFGLYSPELQLDGVPQGKNAVPVTKRPLQDGLQAYFTFNEKQAPVNHAPDNTIKARLYGEKTACAAKADGFADGYLHLEATQNGETLVPSGLCLEGTEKFALGNGKALTVTCWVRMPAKPQAGDPPILSNKNWHDGYKPGFVLVSARQFESAKQLEVGLNYARSGESKRNDMGGYPPEPDQWTFYAFTFTEDGAVYLCQGRQDGSLYWIADHAEDAVLQSGMPWHIGQDGTGNYKCNFLGDIDDFAIWNRSLTIADLRAIYEAGRKGIVLSELLK